VGAQGSFPHTFESMKCNFRALFFMHIFASPCFGRKPKAKVMIWYYQKNLQQDNVHVHHLVIFRSMEQELLNFK
jgi:hypothetical protein